MIKPRDTVYICGPMTGLPDFNYPAFREAEKLIRERYGCRVLNPARQPDGLTWEEYMQRGCSDVVSATVVVVLPGWQKSKGAQEEMACAAIHGIRVVMWEELQMDENLAKIIKGKVFYDRTMDYKYHLVEINDEYAVWKYYGKRKQWWHYEVTDRLSFEIRATGDSPYYLPSRRMMKKR